MYKQWLPPVFHTESVCFWCCTCACIGLALNVGAITALMMAYISPAECRLRKLMLKEAISSQESGELLLTQDAKSTKRVHVEKPQGPVACMGNEPRTFCQFQLQKFVGSLTVSYGRLSKRMHCSTCDCCHTASSTNFHEYFMLRSLASRFSRATSET